MKIFMTMEVEEILNQIDSAVIREYVNNEGIDIYQDKDSDQLWEDLEFQLEKEEKEISIFTASRIDSRELLEKIDEEYILEHIRDNTQYYISEDVGELMEQVRVSGCIDEVAEMFTIKYKG